MSTTTSTPAKRESLAHRLYTGKISYDFVGHRKRWYAISAILLLISFGALLIRGLDLGIEFTGGADFQAKVAVTDRTVDDMHRALRESGVDNLDEATVTTIGQDTVRVQTRTLDSNTEVPKVREAIAKEVKAAPDSVAYNLIGASWGKQITQKAAVALVTFIVLVMLLIGIYFRNSKMSIAAVVALLHDLILTIGIYALVGFTFTPTTLIGLLTILGYSLYDTVVVFDKVRENTRDLTKTRNTYGDVANTAVNQVLVRSLNTTIIGVLPVAALLIAGWFFLGTGPLKDLGLALFVGMTTGAYSSIFIATPLLVEMKEREPAMIAHRERLERRGHRRRHTEQMDEATEAETPTGVRERGTEEGATPTITTATVTPVRTVVKDSAAGRPQPQRQTRSQRRK